MIFTGSFTWEKADGSIEPISVPGRYELPAGETMTIRTTFPSDYDANAIAIRSSLQDIRFYIDGELRTEYSIPNRPQYTKEFFQRLCLL